MTRVGRRLLLGACLHLLVSGSASAQVVDSTLWGTGLGGRVLAIAPAGDTVYIGGTFGVIGPATGGGVPLDARTAKLVAPYARIAGRVEAVVADGEGGWFVGGSFTHVGGQARRNLAHIRADGSLSNWAPDPNLGVWCLALAGRTLYVGGDFDSLGGHSRMRLGAVDIDDDVALPWRCDADGRPSAILVDGPIVYLGGWFTAIAGQPRSYVAAVDATTGALSPWQVSLNDRVRTFALRDTTLYIGGYFWTANGEARVGLIAVSTVTGALKTWNPQLSRLPINTRDGGPHVHALLRSGDSMYVAGSFTQLGGQARRGLAQLDLATAQATAFDSRATRNTVFGPDLWSLVRSGETLFVAGAYDSLGGASREAGLHAAALHTSTGDRFAWDPEADSFIWALAMQRSVVFAAGWFTTVGEWVPRGRLASIDMRTGRVTDWQPNPNDYVKSLRYHNGRVYAGGYFSEVGGQPRSGLAALDPVTGIATPWNPSPNAPVWAIEPLGGDLVVGGLFSSIGGQPRRGIAVVDTISGLVTPWDAQLFGEVGAIAVSDTAIYVGGFVVAVAGQERLGLAALEPSSATLLPWNPGTDGTVDAIDILDGTIYIGGNFDLVGGQARTNLAAIDRDGNVTSWRADLTGPPSPTVQVHDLVATDSTLFVGGVFSQVSGVSRGNFAAIDARTGAVRESYPQPDGIVRSLAQQKGSVFAGGDFSRFGAFPQSGFAAIHPSRTPEPPPTPGFPSLLAAPNPAREATTVRYSLAGPQHVSLTLYDLQGRAISRPLVRALQPAGPQQVQVSTSGLRMGCYLLRLDAGRATSTRKLFVVR